MNTKYHKRAKSFIKTRENHLHEISEDYTELIADLINEKGEARTCTIAELMGVSHVTVSKTLRRLQEQGLIYTEPHHPVVLTKAGKALADFSKKRHEILHNFLVMIGVSEKTAAMDVEGMEHHVSEETLNILEMFVKEKSKEYSQA